MRLGLDHLYGRNGWVVRRRSCQSRIVRLAWPRLLLGTHGGGCHQPRPLDFFPPPQPNSPFFFPPTTPTGVHELLAPVESSASPPTTVTEDGRRSSGPGFASPSSSSRRRWPWRLPRPTSSSPSSISTPSSSAGGGGGGDIGRCDGCVCCGGRVGWK